MTRPSLLVLRVKDLKSAERFYGLLGMRFELHQHGDGPAHLAAVTDGFVFELYELDAGRTPTTSARIGFTVLDVDGAIARARAAGITVVAPPQPSPWGRRAVLADPDGHRVELVTPAPAVP